MPISPKILRQQLARLQPLLESRSLDTIRRAQRQLGELMQTIHRKQVMYKNHPFPNFRSAWVIPKEERRQGVLLYLHGGGYTCGDLSFAKGIGATFADQCGVRVFCPGYRLAPEHPFPAALEDAVEAYRYLLSKGYQQICLCGESAGGGLCYALCLKLQQLELPLPTGIVAISPWVDLTLCGESYLTNRDADPSLTEKQLRFYAQCYAEDLQDPLVSPLFGDLSGMPPSMILAGGDEIMLSDAEHLHTALLKAGSQSQLLVKPERWHAYLLYGLAEDRQDFHTVNRFLDLHLSQERMLRWLRLDNAAKIYPAARRQNWSNIFRLSATLTEPVDPTVLQSALDVTVRRFPSISARLRRGVFWYYLQQLEKAPELSRERFCPLTRMSKSEVRKCAFRVIVYGRRVAVEFFHSLTDGTGGLIFLKTLLAEYLQQKHGFSIPAGDGVLGRLEAPSMEEMEDSFQKYAGPVGAKLKENNAWHLRGTPHQGDFNALTCFQLPVDRLKAAARERGVSVTVFLSAAIMMALQNAQLEQEPNIRHRKHIRVQIPVNLRNLFPSRTLRNFALYTTPEIDPRLGYHDFDEICGAIRHRMGLEITPKQMAAKIAENVNMERLLAVKLLPLFLKNMIMKAVFNTVGERKCCLSISNLGQVTLPESMNPYVERFDFILGQMATASGNCGVITYGDTVYVNFIRNIREPVLESHFFRVLRDMGLPVQVQSNQ